MSTSTEAQEVDARVAGTRTHTLKVWPIYYAAVYEGRKPFEVRRNGDRDVREGDALHLREWDYGSDDYTGGECWRTVTYVLGGDDATAFGIQSGFVVLGRGRYREP